MRMTRPASFRHNRQIGSAATATVDSGHALRTDVRAWPEGAGLDLDVVLGAELVHPIKGDIAAGSDEIAEDRQSGGHGKITLQAVSRRGA